MNLMSEYQLERYGIGIIKTSSGKFLSDHHGTRFPLHVINSKYVIPVGRYDSSGRLHTTTFIVDGGSPFHIVSTADADRIGFEPGGGHLSVSGFGGSTTDLTGGGSWFGVLRDANGCWRAPVTKLTPDLDGPVTDFQLALLLQRFSTLPAFESPATVTLPVTLRSHSRRPCNRAQSPTKSTTYTGPSTNTSDSVTEAHVEEKPIPATPLAATSSRSRDLDIPSKDFDRLLELTRNSPIRAKVTPKGLHGSVRRTPDLDLQRRVTRSQEYMDTMNVSRSTLNDMIKREIIQDAVAISEASPSRTIDREVSGAKLVSRPSSTTITSKKKRVEFEPFHLV